MTKSKTALVTGGAKRVGKAIALALARAGFDVAITCHRSDDQAKQVVAEITALGRQAAMLAVDLAQPDAGDAVFNWYRDTFDQPLFALVNNASTFAASPLGSIDIATFDRNLAVNARSPLMLIQRFAPMLGSHDQPGRVVNFIDIHVMGQPLKHYAAYNASKAALKEITMTLAMELAPKVTVNAIAPGVVAWADSYSKQEREAYMRRVPLDRPGTPDDAARAVTFLVTQADYCTGQIIKLDGGRALT